MPPEPVVQASHVSKSFGTVRVLNDVNFEIHRGEMVGLIGASGSGKSTLIRAIAGLTPIDRGNGTTAKSACSRSPFSSAAAWRAPRHALRVRTGVIFQQFNLVPRLSVLTNVCLGLLGRMPFLRARSAASAWTKSSAAMQALARVGIAEHALKRGSRTIRRTAAARRHRPHARAGRRIHRSPTSRSLRSIRARRAA